MNAMEVAAFERNPHLNDIIKVRVYDESGKHADMQTPPFAYYAPMVQAVIDRHQGNYSYFSAKGSVASSS
jgi:predicted HD phosphohydrolase